MKFKQFCEQKENFNNEKFDYVQRVKTKIMNYINEISTWIQEESSSAKLADIQRKIARLKRFIEDENESVEKIILSQKTKINYKKLYKNLLSVFEEFESPNEDIHKKIIGIKDILAQFNSFIQSQISVPR